MGTPSAEAANARNLFQSKLKPGADDAIKKNREMAEATKELALGSGTVIGTAQVAPIELYVTKVKAQVTKVEASIRALDAALAKLADFAKANKAVLSELPEVDKLNADLAEERRKATTRLPALKAAQDEADKALKALANSRTELNAEWAKVETDAREALEEVLGSVKTLNGHRDKARAAAKSRDAKALTDAKSKAQLVPNPYLSDWPARMKKKLADFAGRYEKQPRLDKNLRAQLTRDKAELDSVLGRIGLNAKLMDEIQREVRAIK
jgi:chromosome segregation ATPase